MTDIKTQKCTKFVWAGILIIGVKIPFQNQTSRGVHLGQFSFGPEQYRTCRPGLSLVWTQYDLDPIWPGPNPVWTQSGLGIF